MLAHPRSFVRPLRLFLALPMVFFLVGFSPPADLSMRTHRRSDLDARSEDREADMQAIFADQAQPAPLLFIENAGQFDQRARFVVRGAMGRTVWLAQDALWVTIVEQTGSSRAANLRVSFAGASAAPRLEPFERLATSVSYFIGNEADKWRSEVPVWASVRYVDVYPGVNLVVGKGPASDLALTVEAAPGTNLAGLRLRVEGAQAVRVDEHGRLIADSAAGPIALPHLLNKEGALLTPSVEGDTVTFSSPNSLSSLRALVPSDDPTDLLYSTFLGGSLEDNARDVALDAAGNIYVTGYTYSMDFPTTPGAFDTSYNGFQDSFVVKFDSAGALVYATLLGGADDDERANDITVDDIGHAYITGRTWSFDFPTTPGAFDTIYNGGKDAFVVKINLDGSALDYSTFFGGTGEDGAVGIAVDATGNAYFTGGATSADLPVTPGAYDETQNGSHDAYVAKLNSAGDGVVYCTFLGGLLHDEGFVMALSEAGSATVTGDTQSSNFPTTDGAYDTTFNGEDDAFVVRLNPGGTGLEYSTLLGGAGEDAGRGMALDDAGNAYVSGFTFSSDFPTTAGAFDTGYNGNGDSFVLKVNPTGSGLDYATYLGGSSNDEGRGLDIDWAGSVYHTGQASSSNFPIADGAFDSSHNGLTDGFLVKLNLAGSALDYATFLGGTNADGGVGITLDGMGSVYLAGQTFSADFPTTPGAFDTGYNGAGDAFVARIAVPVGLTALVSVASDGTQGNNNSFARSISADGRYVAFRSDASNLVSGDTNGVSDTFVHDRLTQQMTRISVATGGAQGNGASYWPKLSSNGRFAAFESDASNLVTGDTNGVRDVFLHDRQLGQTTRLSLSTGGVQGNGTSWFASISSRGRIVTFQSDATNLVAGDTNAASDILVRDRQTGQTTRVSVATGGAQSNGHSYAPFISGNERYVAFWSLASNLVAGDTNASPDVFVHDRQTGQTTRVSIASGGAQGDNDSMFPSISSNGRYVAFVSLATNLVGGDTNGAADIFVHNRATGQTTRVSVATDGTQSDGDSANPAISADGLWVAFESLANNLVVGDTSGAQDIFIHDRLTGETTRVSVSSGGAQGNGTSGFASVSSNGRYVAFDSEADNLVAGDLNAVRDAFLYDRGP